MCRLRQGGGMNESEETQHPAKESIFHDAGCMDQIGPNHKPNARLLCTHKVVMRFKSVSAVPI